MARPKEKEVVITSAWVKRTYKLRKDGSNKKMAWRKTVFTPEVVHKLEELFENDVAVWRALKFVWVSESAYYAECERNPSFKEKMQKAQEYVGILADRTVAKAIKEWDVQTAKWLKEKTDERYKQKPTQINMQQWIDPETWEAIQGLMVEFTIKD